MILAVLSVMIGGVALLGLGLWAGRQNSGNWILATLAALCARVMFRDVWLPKVALADSRLRRAAARRAGNLGLSGGAPSGHYFERAHLRCYV